MDNRESREVQHGQKLAQTNPETVWGWNSPAGLIRAKRRAAMISASAHLDGAKRVLEIGCGTGLFTELFFKAGPEAIVAVDISPELLAIAQKRSLPSNRVIFKCIRFEELEKTEPFDAVIGSSVLHHLAMPDSLLTMARLMRSGAYLCFTEPNMLNPQIALQKNIPWLKRMMGDSPDEKAFFRWQLAKTLATSGFTNITIKPFDWLHPATPPRLIRVVRAMGIFMEKIPFLREFAGSLCISAKKS
jgi:2-polyprenyl-3-methyl-5-hydroxy-6-metoxy-1,4-benzoquinol methylase